MWNYFSLKIIFTKSWFRFGISFGKLIWKRNQQRRKLRLRNLYNSRRFHSHYHFQIISKNPYRKKCWKGCQVTAEKFINLQQKFKQSDSKQKRQKIWLPGQIIWFNLHIFSNKYLFHPEVLLCTEKNYKNIMLHREGGLELLFGLFYSNFECW